MNAVIRHFCWTNVQKNNKTKSIYLKSWQKFAVKERGWIRHQKFREVNAAWKIVTLLDSNTTQILKAKYFQSLVLWS
jgi:hypothetical protein